MGAYNFFWKSLNYGCILKLKCYYQEMNRFEKLLKDFTYDGLTRLLSGLGYEKELIQNSESLSYKRGIKYGKTDAKGRNISDTA